MSADGLCLEGGGDTSGDTEGDTSETDSDTDADTDTDTDTDTDVGTDTGSTADLLVCASGGDFATISEALLAAAAGDTIAVCPGTYHETLTITRPVTIESTDGSDLTIIDADRSGRLVDISGGGSVSLRDLTFEGGEDSTASVLYADESDVIIESCVFRESASEGVTMWFQGGSLVMTNSEVRDTTAHYGSGLVGYGADINITTTVFEGQESTTAGREVLLFLGGDVELFNVLISDAQVPTGYLVYAEADSLFVVNSIFDLGDAGSAVQSDTSHGATYTFQNTVFYGTGTGGALGLGGAPLVEYSNFYNLRFELCTLGGCESAAGSNGNFAGDPRFIDPTSGDWSLDAFSPCIDAGNPAAAYNDLDGSRNDVGLHGGPASTW